MWLSIRTCDALFIAILYQDVPKTLESTSEYFSAVVCACPLNTILRFGLGTSPPGCLMLGHVGVGQTLFGMTNRVDETGECAFLSPSTTGKACLNALLVWSVGLR